MIKRYTKQMAFVFIFFVGYVVNAQVQNNGSMYVGDTGVVYLASGNFNFGNAPALTATSRTGSVYGKLAFAPGTTWSNTSSSKYIDGYARSVGASAFIFPIGQSGVYAPVKVIPAGSSSIDAAYYRSNPNVVGVALDSGISTLSNLEYWDIRGSSVDAVVSISWNASSNIAALTSSTLSDLTIAGWNGFAWVPIPSTVDNTSILGSLSSLMEGSITTNSNVNLSMYAYFTLGVSACLPLITSSGNVKIWSGTWNSSIPTLEDPVIINAPYTGDLKCNSLILNQDVTLSNGQVLEIVNGVSGSGKIIMASEASVLQRNPTSNAPTIQMTKVTNPMRRYDYVFLSSPINSSSAYFSDLRNKDNVAVNGSFGTQLYSAFDAFMTFDASGLNSVSATVANTPVGRGFSATVRNMSPYSTLNTQGQWYDQKFPIHIKTTGIANNGNVSIMLPTNAWARIGNPYPSAIDCVELLDALGPNVRKTIYLWTFNTPRKYIANSSDNYNNADFATWNYSGGVAVCPTCQVPSGKIATMQSVLVKTINNVGPTNFNLTNCMRVTTGNNNFFKTSATSLDRFWLNLSGSNDSFSQTLIAYSQNGTLAFDDGYDSSKIGGVLTSQLTTLIGSTKCVIQTRPVFVDTDEVPIQIDQVNGETLTISLGNKEGIFANGLVSIFLFDSLLNIYHDLTLGDYTYIPNSANDSTRFKIVYQSPSLSNTESVYSYNVVALINNQTLNIQSSIPMNTIEIFDIAGRNIISFKVNGSTILSKSFNHEKGVYLVKISFDNGAVSTQKLISK